MQNKKSVLQEAEELIHGARQQAYNHPYIDFGRTAKMLSGLLKSKLKDGVEIDIEDVPLIMVCVKLSRLMATPGHRDSMVDGPGYFGTYEMVMDRKNAVEGTPVDLGTGLCDHIVNSKIERERINQNLRAGVSEESLTFEGEIRRLLGDEIKDRDQYIRKLKGLRIDDDSI